MTTATPRKKRLNKDDRYDLRQLAFGLVTASQELLDALAAAETAEKSAYEAFTVEALKRIKSIPDEDAAVLEKYKLVDEDSCVYVTDESRDIYTNVNLTRPFKRPARSGCNNRNPLLLDGDLLTTFDAMRAAENAVREARQAAEHDRTQRQKAYQDLIAGSKHFEDVVEVWPEAEQLRAVICGTGTALAVVSQETVDLIKADVARRQAA